MTYISLNNWDDGPFGSIGRVDALPSVFKTTISLRNFTAKELSAEIPELSDETKNGFCNVLDRNPQLAHRKELNIPNASPCRYTLTEEGVAAIKTASQKLTNVLRSQKTVQLKWDRPKHGALRTPFHA